MICIAEEEEMKSRSLHHLILSLLFVLAFGAGYMIGARGLGRCRALNKTLTEDLSRAVVRGITAEANLIQCKEQKK